MRDPVCATGRERGAQFLRSPRSDDGHSGSINHRDADAWSCMPEMPVARRRTSLVASAHVAVSERALERRSHAAASESWSC